MFLAYWPSAVSYWHGLASSSSSTIFLASSPQKLLHRFLCQLTCQSADIMSSLCGVGVRVRVRVNNFFSKTTRPRDMLFFLKDTLSIEDEKLFKACKSVCSSVCQRHYKGGTPTKSVKISTFYHNFLSDYCRDFSHILHICTRPEVDSPV